MNLTYHSPYNGYTINVNEDKNLACITSILNKYHAHLEDMLNKHSKVLQIRFDLHYCSDGSVIPSPKHLNTFTYNLKRSLNRQTFAGGHRPDPRILTVLEKHHQIQPHIHGLILLNANAINKYYPVLLEIERLWCIALGTTASGLTQFCDKGVENGIIIDRNKPETYFQKVQDCVYQASYLAKERGKENLPKGSWLVKGTRLSKN